MAVIRCQEAKTAADLVAKRGGKREWVCPYNLKVDSATDDGQTIVDYFDTIDRGLSMGMIYGDREDLTVICKEIHPTRDPNSRFHWTATLHYSALDATENQDQVDEDGNPAENPLDWRYDISSGTANIQIPVDKAWNVDQMPKDGTAPGYVRPADTLGPVHNSAGIIYDPPLLVDITETVLRISGNLPSYAQSKLTGKANRINQGTLVWHSTLLQKYGFEMASFPQYCVLCSAATADFRRENGIAYWRYTYEFRIRERASATNPIYGHLETVLDRGITRIANAGAPDGAGGTISAGDIEVGMAEAAAIRDWQGERVPELVLLDGHGRPLQGSSTLSAPPVYFRWRKHPYAEFAYSSVPLKIFDP